MSYKVVDKELISIPYGAIKRNSKRGIGFSLFKISIPYGAIKSLVNVSEVNDNADFNSLWCD